MKTKLKLLLCLPFILLLFEDCKPDEKCVDGNYYKYIDDYFLNKIPYKDYSTISFLNKKTNDTLVFSGQGYQFGFSKYIEQGECPQTNNLQYRSLTFLNNKNVGNILIENKFIDPTICKLGITYKNYSKIFYAADVSKPFAYDSLIIQGVKYYDVEYLKDEFPNTSFLSIYYNLNYGILKLETNSGDTLELIKLEL